MNAKIIALLTRHVLSSVGLVLVSEGVVEEGIAQELTGSIAAIAGIVWSVIEKKSKQ